MIERIENRDGNGNADIPLFNVGEGCFEGIKVFLGAGVEFLNRLGDFVQKKYEDDGIYTFGIIEFYLYEQALEERSVVLESKTSLLQPLSRGSPEHPRPESQ